MAGAPEFPPPISSSSPKASSTVRRGRAPAASSASTASRCASTATLSSSVPRPHTNPPATAPEKGGCSQASSVPGSTGTTSWCAMSTSGGSAASAPGQV
jgi:hypothetical protein